VSKDESQIPNIDDLGRVKLAVTREEALGELERRARRGKLAGFALENEGFRCAAFGNPFDAELLGRFENESVEFSIRHKPMIPVIVWIVLALAVWPGTWMTDSILTTYFSSYPWFISSFWWQVIIAVLTASGAPVILKQQKASKVAQQEHALKSIEKIRGWIG